MGILTITLFLVGFLIAVFRYSMRLAAFCEGRAGALELHKNVGVGLAELMGAFSPGLFDFGGLPKDASDPAAQFARQFMLPAKTEG